MPNKEPLNSQLDALRAMLNDREMEVHAHADIIAMIEAELEKDVDDIDADLVDELVRLNLELEASTSQELQRHSPKGRRHRRGGRRFVVVLVSALVLSVAVMGVASAFNWARLVRIFAPLMQTLGIRVDIDDEEESGEYEREVLIETPDADEEEQEPVSILVRDESVVPELLDGYPTKPKWVPKGYEFSYASIFEHFIEKSVCLIYTDGIRELAVQTKVYLQKATDYIEYETDTPILMGSGVQVTEDYDIITATLVDEAVYYTVWGMLPKEDIISVITSIRGE